MWWNCAWMGVLSNGALCTLYGQRARASIRGRWTLIGVGYKLGRSSSVITGWNPRSVDLLAASSRVLGESLAPQARRILWDLEKVFWSLPRSPGLWIRSSGPLAGRRGSWQVRSTWQGPLVPWSVGTYGYRCLSLRVNHYLTTLHF
jgi:hypothetical protein